ncbi:MAG TPA: methyltransferase domain-containing protein [Stellaceae bacterium]|nr:methyltransferase domain-containing protein [Stellaceae bacterium]
MSSIYTATDAAAYERLMGRWSRSLAEPFIAFAGIESGDRVLDLGCGTGSLTFALAARPEPSQILGIDIAEPYIAHARACALDARLAFRVGDAAALAVPDAGFDRCYSLLALNFVKPPMAAIREMMRVTRPGGTIAAAVWDFAGGLTYQRIFWDTAAARDPEAAKARARHYASALTWPGELEAAFSAAGARDVAGGSLTTRMVYENFADYWDPIVHAQGPVGDYVRTLDAASLAALADAVASAYGAGRPDGPRSMTATAWAARGKA